MNLTAADIARFWSKVRRGSPTECWPYLMDGVQCPEYGTFHKGSVSLGAHRVSYTIANGPLRPRQQVCHRCDHPWCVNPAHLFAGTHKSNMRDKKIKGRAVRLIGAANGQTVIPDAIVVRIYKAYKRGGITQLRLAKLFGVKRSQVADIVNRRTRRNLTR